MICFRISSPAAYQSLRKFKGNSVFYTCIYQIAISHSLNLLRNKKPLQSVDLE